MVSNVALRRKLEQAVVEMMAAAVESESRWGVDDCTLWAVEPIRRVLGYDPASKGRGHYKTRIGALRVLGKGGLPAALRHAARRHGWKRVEPKEAGPGDLGLIEVNGTLSMSVCRSRGWFVVRGDEGYAAYPANLQRIAWCVI